MITLIASILEPIAASSTLGMILVCVLIFIVLILTTDNTALPFFKCFIFACIAGNLTQKWLTPEMPFELISWAYWPGFTAVVLGFAYIRNRNKKRSTPSDENEGLFNEAFTKHVARIEQIHAITDDAERQKQLDELDQEERLKRRDNRRIWLGQGYDDIDFFDAPDEDDFELDDDSEHELITMQISKRKKWEKMPGWNELTMFEQQDIEFAWEKKMRKKLFLRGPRLICRPQSSGGGLFSFLTGLWLGSLFFGDDD